VLTYWSATNADEAAFARRIAEEWNARGTGVRVAVRPVPSGQSSEEVILAAVASHTTPDIYASAFPGQMQDLIDARGVVRLDDFPDFAAVLGERMAEDTLEQYRAPDGHYYQVPWKTNPILVQYNTRLLREVGVESLPETYEEFLAAAARVSRDRDGDGAIDQWMTVVDYSPVWYKRLFDFYPLYLAATGGRTLLDGRTATFADEHSAAVFEFFRRCFEEGYAPRQTLQGDLFLDGRIASRFTGPWSVNHVERYRPDGFEYAFGPIPTPSRGAGPPVTYADPKSVIIFATCEHPREAWDFVKFMISSRNDLLLLDLTSQLPIRSGLADDPEFAAYFERNPRMRRFADQVAATRTCDSVPELREIFDIIAQEFEASAVFGLKSPEEAVRDAARRSQSVLDVG
jgi:multiple sugar transport system substrate-binding protein